MSKSRDLGEFPAAALDINASGNLDVTGTVTADGLVVDGNAEIVSIEPILKLEDTRSTLVIGDKLGRLDFYGNDDSSAGTGTKASVKAVVEDATGQYVGLAFGTTTNVTPDVERVRIDAYGNFGIGTSFPSGLARTLNIDGGTAGSSIAIDGGANFAVTYVGATAGDPTSMFSNTGFKFATATAKNATGFSEKMRISSAGHITTPHQPAFHAVGSGSWATLPTGVVTHITSWGSVTERGAYFNVNTGKFFAAVSGWYSFTFNSYTRSNSAGAYCYPRLRLNGVGDFGWANSIQHYMDHADSNLGTTTTVTMYMAQNDYVQAAFYASNGTCEYHHGSQAFSGYLIG